MGLSNEGQTVVGIAGGSCSGKSTLAESIRTALASVSCELYSIDSYMLQDKGPKITLSTGEVHPNNNSPLSTDNARLVEDLKNCQAEVILVEGLMALHLPELLPLYDLKLFVDLDPATRAVRRMVRSLKRKPDWDPEWVGRYYLECAVPGHQEFVEPSRRLADLVVQGDGDVARTGEMLALLIRNLPT